MWMCQYETLQNLATRFGIGVSSVHRVLHQMLPLLHSLLVRKHIVWHDMNTWRNLSGYFPTWPRVVAILDCTPFRISKPKGNLQRLFWRRDRKCFFLNWLVIIDVTGKVVYSRPGFVGHISDATVYKLVFIHVSMYRTLA